LLALRTDHDAAVCARVLPRVLPLAAGLEVALQDGIDVLDLGASVAPLLAHAFPRSRVTAADAADLDRPEGAARFDCAVGLFRLALEPSPSRMLASVRRALRPGGRLLCLEHAASSQLSDDAESAHAARAYAESTLLALPLAGEHDAGALGLMCGDARARKLLRESGFVEVEVRRIPGDREHHALLARAPTGPAARSS
jgi:hypothetical protein